MEVEKSKRVGAILSSKDGIVEFIGYGVYVGDEVPKGDIGGIGKILQESKIPNPKIVLDSGKVVYGCECWWGPELNVRSHITQFKEVIEVDIDEIRKKDKEENTQS